MTADAQPSSESDAVTAPGGPSDAPGVVSTDVSEPPVLEAEPAAAQTLFGDRIDVARSFTNELARRGEELGLIGPLELPRLWTRHILNSALLAPLLTAGGHVGDVGSGAGLPGLVLAIARPDVTFTLIEPMERRVEWLTAEAARLGLENVSVLRARAEDVSDELVLDQVTARAVSALSKLIPITVPLVRSGGELILMKGARVDDEVAAARKVILRKRLENVEVLELGVGVVEETTRVFRATVD
ncbi:16S rRNA (guanine(527)-N(7))-methyltransferase RsmG [Curtobacterium sp. VKM Ac-1395]|nr:16S rRNA (guanine(527)-N(7))-methyltransferase RsmG [Curtobacterium sp. VKM Ac-1395]